MKKSDLTKQSIIKEATKLFYKNGYQLTSTKQLAQAIGYSEGLIFKYFKSKHGLLNAVMLQITDQLKENSVEELTNILNAPLSFQEKLKKFIENRIRFVEDNIEVITIIIHQTHYDENLRKMISIIVKDKVNTMILNFLKVGVSEGVIDEKYNLDLPLALIKNLIFEAIFENAILRHEYNKSSIFEKVDIIIRGIS